MTGVGVAAAVLSKDMQMRTVGEQPGLKMIVGQPESASGASRNFRLSWPCTVQVPTCFVGLVKVQVGNTYLFTLTL